MKIALLLFCTAFSLTAHTQPSKHRPTEQPLTFQTLFSATAHEKVACYRIPALATAPNGDLLAAIDERVPGCGDLKLNEDINIVMRRSADNGASWSDIESVINYPLGQSASDPSMIVDTVTSTIFLFFNFMDLRKEKDVYYLRYVTSTNNGKSWSKPVDITDQIAKPEWHTDFKFITSGRGTQTSDGKLLHTLVNLAKGLHIFGSNDHGESWYLIDTPLTPADESKIIELSDGTWMVNSRVNDEGLRYVHTSTNAGATWMSRPDSSLIDPGCNASILRYPTNRNNTGGSYLLFSNAKDENDRQNMTVRVSTNDGKSWNEGRTIYEGSSAYSSLTILGNGDIGLFFEKDNYQENVFVRIKFDELTNSLEASSPVPPK